MIIILILELNKEQASDNEQNKGLGEDVHNSSLGEVDSEENYDYYNTNY